SGLNATLLTSLGGALRVKSSWPVWVSHTFTSPPLALARRLPSRLKATLKPPPLRVRTSWPFWASHTFSAPGPDRDSPVLAEARRLPSGLKATLASVAFPSLRGRAFWRVRG